HIYCAGSFFKNVTVPGQERRQPAAFLIEQSGCKGLSVGDCQVSPKHANFLVNNGSGTFAQLEELVGIVRDRVHKQFGIELEQEVIFYP
ncbi:MAG: UDP-N-acetylenolpyruvoylglucosamine reductase, partial [Candidatus Wallbacteria bacterium]|nr:UDP-N-acetylenolpyruvoylglucosamine reductase [Candidatus Wallbacteria bacterium]